MVWGTRQAEYWHDPLNEQEYIDKSVFLADINNEKVKNPTYKANLVKLQNMVLVKFLNDTMVQPYVTAALECFALVMGTLMMCLFVSVQERV